MSLCLELVKHCTTLCRLSYLDDLMTRMTGVDTEVWALKCHNFPEKLIPHNSKSHLCYMGILKEKLNASYGQVHFLTFGHENFLEDASMPNTGVLEYMYDMYCEHVKLQGGSDEDEVNLYPIQIDEESLDYWVDIAKNTWGIKEKGQLKEFIKYNELSDWVDWEGLEEYLPLIDYPSESETDSESETESDTESETESETESDTEDGEIKHDEDEPPRKRRKYKYDSEDEA